MKGEINLLRDEEIRKPFSENVFQLVDIGILNLWGHFEDSVIRAGDGI